ncbi:helix-turn-helix domain-containing protein [Gordonia sp. MP11Mi]|uniref:Helix-turn-helix domain-containing protein n=1 Tax=Gordonia sp. MP11Mi TaxID=3022769 RepID=A0AA97CWL3_9ACTN
MIHHRVTTLSALRDSDAAALTRQEVADLFGIDARAVSSAVASGELPCIRIGRKVFIPREPLLAMLTKVEQ